MGSARFNRFTILGQFYENILSFYFRSICHDWTKKRFFLLKSSTLVTGAAHERSWKGTHERRRSWSKATSSTKLVSGLRRCSPGYSRHATCKKAKQDLQKPNASPRSATGYGSWIRIA
jgi:hypothetical protein